MTTTSRYSAADLARFREDYAETEFLVHVLGPDMTVVADDEGKPFTLYEADRLARRVNDARSPLGWQHATVFHYGRPLAAPEDIPPAPAFNADELAFFKQEYGESEWMAYIHGMDECFDHNEDADEPFTEADVRKLVADMAVWNREHVAEGPASTPVSVFRFGEPFALEAAAEVAE
jgi:hypothetical protein